MTLTAEPTISTTSTGAPLPLVALPQGEGANVNFTEDGQYHSILDSMLIRHLTDTPGTRGRA